MLQSIALVDSDLVRRAKISHALSNNSIHVEPFEGIVELVNHWPRIGVILAYDDGKNVPALIAHMGHTGDWLPVVAFSENAAPMMIVEAIMAGAVAYLGWPFDKNELSETMTKVEMRADILGHAKLREARARSRIERLTRREREVLSCVASGFSSRVIGEKLEISPRTVEIHRANMLQKMGANHTSEAIRIAIEASLVA